MLIHVSVESGRREPGKLWGGRGVCMGGGYLCVCVCGGGYVGGICVWVGFFVCVCV